MWNKLLVSELDKCTVLNVRTHRISVGIKIK